MTTAHAEARILPFYLVVDVSYSMTEDGKMDSANGIVAELAHALAENPSIADKVRFSVLDFSDDSHVVVPLCDLSMQATPTTPFVARGGTSFIAAFRMLRSRIEQDVTRLQADGFDVHRPAVFFLSDGEPTDGEQEWRAAFQELIGHDPTTQAGSALHPNVIPFGVGPRPETLKALIHPRDRSRCYFMKEGTDAGAALRQMAKILVASTLLSGASFGNGGPGFVLPDENDLPEGLFAADHDLV